MRKFFEWCLCFSCSRRILDYLEAHVTFWDSSKPRSLPKKANPRTVSEIADATGVSDWRVRVCLPRLSRKGLVEMPTPDYWQMVLYP